MFEAAAKPGIRNRRRRYPKNAQRAVEVHGTRKVAVVRPDSVEISEIRQAGRVIEHIVAPGAENPGVGRDALDEEQRAVRHVHGANVHCKPFRQSPMPRQVERPFRHDVAPPGRFHEPLVLLPSEQKASGNHALHFEQRPGRSVSERLRQSGARPPQRSFVRKPERDESGAGGLVVLILPVAEQPDIGDAPQDFQGPLPDLRLELLVQSLE